jgi:late competence protein required for DNA uptake (superfamily II DNA/RNA helicase)
MLQSVPLLLTFSKQLTLIRIQVRAERNQNTQQGTTAFDHGVSFVLISNDTIHERGVTIYRQGEIWFS